MDYSNISRNELLVARIECDASLLYFTRFWYRVLRGTKFITNWHHDEICNELKKVEGYELELLNINIPPRFSKTELAAVNMIARGIGMNPAGNYLYITASDELRAQTSVSIRDIVSHPYFQIMYGVDLKKDQNAKNLWRTTLGGGLKTATIFGQVTGFGAGQMIDHTEELANYIRNFEGCIVLDDINKTDDAEQENANNDKVSRVIFNTIFSRKNSPDTPIINIQQRSGMSDSTQQFIDHYGLDNPKAKFLVYPVLFEGKPLWDWKHNMEAIEELRTSPKTSHVFETQYMQNPQPKEGIVFAKDELMYFRKEDIDLSTAQARCAFVDVADKGNDNHAIPFGYIIGQKVFIPDVVFTKEATGTNVPMTIIKANEHRPEYMQVESNFGGSMYSGLLNMSKDPKMNGYTGVITMNQSSNKHTRILTCEGFVKRYVYFLEPTEYSVGSEYELFMKNLCEYTRTSGDVKHDDAPDSLAGLVKMMISYYPHLFDGVTIQDPQ